MRIGIFAKTFAGSDPATVLRASAAAGYETVQYNMACSGLPSLPNEITGAQAAAVAQAAQDAGVSVSAVSATYNMIHPDAAVRDRGHASLDVIAGACSAMGTDLITLCTGTRDPDDQWCGHPDNDTPAAWADLCDAMARAVEIAERHDVRLGIEPELANVVNSASAARSLIDEMQSDRLCIVLDPANLFEIAPLEDQRRIVGDAIDLLSDRIAMAHAKDRAPDGTFVGAGQGVLDYEWYFRALDGIGFAGAMVTHGLDAGAASATATFLRDRSIGLGR